MTLIKADEQRRFTSDLTHSHWSWLICGIFTIESVLFYWQYKINQESDDRNGFNEPLIKIKNTIDLRSVQFICVSQFF